MATIPTPRTWTNGEATDANMMNNLTDCVNFIHYRPGASIFRSTNIRIPRATTLLIPWNLELYDYDSNHSNTGLTTRLTINTTGKYQITGSALYAPGTSMHVGSDLWMGITKNMAGVYVGGSANIVATDTKLIPSFGTRDIGGAPPGLHVDILYPLNAGDYLEMFLWYDGSSTATRRTINGGESAQTSLYFAAQWVGA